MRRVVSAIPEGLGGVSSGTFSAQVTDGHVRVDADGKGFAFEGKAWVTETVAGELTCGPGTKSGVRSGSLEVTVRGEWRAGEGEPTVVGWDDYTNLRHHIHVINPPWVLETP